MIRHYILLSIRKLLRNKVFLLVNALGLGFSLACCIAAYLWMAYDWEFDHFHKDEKVADIYKIHSHWENPNPGQNILTPFAMAPTAKEELSGIERFTRYYFEKGTIRTNGENFPEGVAFADKDFFELFDFQVISGDLALFRSDNYAVITSELANKVFEDMAAVGQTVSIKLGHSEPVDLIVAAVIADIPQNSSFTFDVMVRIEQFQSIRQIPANDWGRWPAYSTFLKIPNPANVPVLEQQIQKYLKLCKGDQSKFRLEHFKANFTMNEILGAMVNVRMYREPALFLAGLAGLIFLIACFNLANTSFALLARRFKEIGIRKTLGANRHHIFIQFLIEITITIFLSMVIGLILAAQIIPFFADMWAQGIGNRWDTLIFRLDDISGLGLTVSVLMLVFLGIAVAGVYPAVVNSRLRPAKLLRGEEKIRGTSIINKFLLVFQFSVSLMVLICGIVLIQNSSYMINRDPGFDRDFLTFVQVENETDLDDFSVDLETIAGVERIARSRHHLGTSNGWGEILIHDQAFSSKIYQVGPDYFETVGIRVKEGRALLSSDDRSVVVTEKFADMVGNASPLGMRIDWHGATYTVVGVAEDVLEDFYMVDLLNQTPLIFTLSDPKNDSFLIVRGDASDENLLSQIRTKWYEIFPALPFSGATQKGQFMNGSIMTSFNLRNAFIFLTCMTLIISCMGIYALSTLNVERRKAEIGIRKVLGATLMQLVNLINREFLTVLLISVVIGSVSAHLLLQNVLDSGYKIIFINLDWVPFFVAIISVILMGSMTSSATIFRTSLQNPVKNLRKE